MPTHSHIGYPCTICGYPLTGKEAIEYVESKAKNCFIPDVMQRSEQLIDFLRWLKPIPEDKVLNTDEKELVAEYLKSINCT